VQAAGHDHTLQLLQHDSVYYVVSGAGSKSTRVKMGANSLWAREGVGFAVIRAAGKRPVEIKFYTPDAKDLEQSVYAATLPRLLPRPIHRPW